MLCAFESLGGGGVTKSSRNSMLSCSSCKHLAGATSLPPSTQRSAATLLPDGSGALGRLSSHRQRNGQRTGDDNANQESLPFIGSRSRRRLLLHDVLPGANL